MDVPSFINIGGHVPPLSHRDRRPWSTESVARTMNENNTTMIIIYIRSRKKLFIRHIHRPTYVHIYLLKCRNDMAMVYKNSA